MKSFTLVRVRLPKKTVGFIDVEHDGKTTRFLTLELPDKNNAVNISCIPNGNYIVDRDTTGKHQYYRLREVEGRTDIEIHPARSTRQLQGCIALGLQFALTYDLVNSEEACNLFLELVGDESFMLSIRDFNSYHDEWV